MDITYIYIILYVIIFFITWVFGFKTVKNAKQESTDEDLRDTTNGEIIFVSGFFSLVWPIMFIMSVLDIILRFISGFIHMILPDRFFEWLNEKI